MVKIVSEFVAFCRENPLLALVNLGLTGLWPLNDLIVPILSGAIVSAVQLGQPFLKLLVLLVVTLVGFNASYMLMYWHDGIMIPRLQNFLRHRMIVRLMHKYQGDYRELPAGEIVSKTARLPMIAVYLIDRMKNSFVPYIFSFIASSVYVIFVQWDIGLVMLACVTLILVITTTAPMTCRAAGQHQEAVLAGMHEQTDDTVRNLLAVYAAGTLGYEIRSLEQAERTYDRAFMQTTLCVLRTRALGLAVLALMLSLIGWKSYANLKNGCMTPGAFVTIFMILMNICSTLSWMTSSIGDIVVEWNTMGSPDDDVDTPLTTQTQGALRGAPPGPQPPLSVSFVDVSYTVANRSKPIIDSLSLHVPAGQRVALVGQIGSGKSSLMKLLLRLSVADSGQIKVGDDNVMDVELRELRRTVGYVAQQPVLFDRSIFENLVYGSEYHDTSADGVDPAATKRLAETRVNEMLRDLGLADAFDDLQGGLDAVAGKGGSNLSGGQRQIVQCIRTLLWNPRVIVLDEVTASLDPSTKSRLMGLVTKVMSGRTAFIITHDQDVLNIADRIVTLQAGRIVRDVELKRKH